MTDDVLKYKRLSPEAHVRARPGMYIGSTSNTTTDCFVPVDGEMVKQTITYSPALLKMFDEIVSNSVDEHIRTGKIKTIRVNFNRLDSSITVSDDGGIPVKKHPEYKTWIPTMIFGELRTGSNFDDDSRLGAGMNGLGAKLTSIFSKEFRIETHDGKKSFIQVFRDSLAKKTQPIMADSKKKGTTITFTPDYETLGCEMDEENIKRLTKRVYDIAGCNEKIKVYLDGELIKINKFVDYMSMYVDDDQVIEYKTDNWHLGVAPTTDDSFSHISFVNGVDTFNGGTHVDYIINQITSELRQYIKKKHKVDVKPNNIKQQMTLFINCTVNAPVFTSQTKEFMSLEPKEYGTTCDIPTSFINKLAQSEVCQKVLDWVEAEKRRKELQELRKMNKQTQNTNFLKKIVKFDDATSKKRGDCILALTEGDSASKSILSCRDPKVMGVYPLKGKPINVRDVKVNKLTSNQEFANIMAILGLKLGHDTTKEDGEFYVIEEEGKEYLINEHDEIFVDGEWIKFKR